MKNIWIDPSKIIQAFPRQSQEAIAEAVGLSRPTVSAWLKGTPKAIDRRVLAVWCDVCNASPGDFIKFEDAHDDE